MSSSSSSGSSSAIDITTVFIVVSELLSATSRLAAIGRADKSGWRRSGSATDVRLRSTPRWWQGRVAIITLRPCAPRIHHVLAETFVVCSLWFESVDKRLL